MPKIIRNMPNADLQSIDLSPRDVLVGIATSGRTPYVIGGLKYARQSVLWPSGISCNDLSRWPECDLCITPVVGPEVISGSTRLKAGTATKMVLNMLTTGAMVRLGKTYGNLMVDLRATNAKLTHRTRRIVADADGGVRDRSGGATGPLQRGTQDGSCRSISRCLAGRSSPAAGGGRRTSATSIEVNRLIHQRTPSISPPPPLSPERTEGTEFRR